MTLAEFNDKIAQLRIVQIEAEGSQLKELNTLLEGLETKRIEFLAIPSINIETTLTEGDIAVFNYVSKTFKNSKVEIELANTLIENAIVLGKKLLDECKP